MKDIKKKPKLPIPGRTRIFVYLNLLNADFQKKTPTATFEDDV
jgi:hypothetical protein